MATRAGSPVPIMKVQKERTRIDLHLEEQTYDGELISAKRDTLYAKERTRGVLLTEVPSRGTKGCGSMES